MKEDLKYKSSIGVIGAGIQGVCISLSLIKKGKADYKTQFSE